MTVPYTKVIEATGATMVAGRLVLYADGKNVELGRKAGSAFNYTPAGEAIARSLETAAEPAPRRRSRKPAEEAPAEEGRQLELPLSDTIEMGEELG